MWATFVSFPVERLDQMFELRPRPKWHFALASVWDKVTNPIHAILNRDLGRKPCPWCAAFGDKITMKSCKGHTLCRDHLRSKRA